MGGSLRRCERAHAEVQGPALRTCHARQLLSLSVCPKLLKLPASGRGETGGASLAASKNHGLPYEELLSTQVCNMQ